MNKPCLWDIEQLQVVKKCVECVHCDEANMICKWWKGPVTHYMPRGMECCFLNKRHDCAEWEARDDDTAK